jgi:hypothetical protein
MLWVISQLSITISGKVPYENETNCIALLAPCSLLLAPCSSAAEVAPFESVIDAMAIKSSDGYTNNGWEDVSKIKGVKWKWSYSESGAHDSTMVGKTKVGKDKNPNIGATEVTVSGARTMIASVKISVANASSDIKAFGEGRATKIKTSCDDDSASNTVEFYKFEKSGYKPLFISYQTSWGAGGSGSVDFEVTYNLNDALRIYPDPCKVLR